MVEGRKEKKFFCVDLVTKNFYLDGKVGAGDPSISRSLSCARLLPMPVSTRSLARRGRERESNLKKRIRKGGGGDLDNLCFFFFAAHEPVDLLEVKLLGFTNGVDVSMMPVVNTY